MTRIFRAKQNLFFGIKKNDIFAYEKDVTYRLKGYVPGSNVILRDNDAMDFDLLNEISFFDELLPDKYKKDNIIMLSVTQGKIPAYTELKVLCMVDKKIRVEWQKLREEIVDKNIFHPEYYFFYNSKGITNREIVGRDARADNFRKCMGNYFKTAPECNLAVEKILAN